MPIVSVSISDELYKQCQEYVDRNKPKYGSFSQLVRVALSDEIGWEHTRISSEGNEK